METKPRWGGDLLREWRQAQSPPLSLYDLAQDLGVRDSRISQIETDPTKGPGLELAERIEARTDGYVPVPSWRKKFAVMVDPEAAAQRGVA